MGTLLSAVGLSRSVRSVSCELLWYPAVSHKLARRASQRPCVEPGREKLRLSLKCISTRVSCTSLWDPGQALSEPSPVRRSLSQSRSPPQHPASLAPTFGWAFHGEVPGIPPLH